MCIDNIKIGPASDPEMGRGAFSARPLVRGQPVAPAPLQTFATRDAFIHDDIESLLVNYSFQPAS
jgi:hypothetical protein